MADMIKITRINLLTHTSLDGFGCIQLVKYYSKFLGISEPVVEIANHSNISEKFDKWAKEVNTEGTFSIIAGISLPIREQERFHKMFDEGPMAFFPESDKLTGTLPAPSVVLCDYHKETFESEIFVGPELMYSDKKAIYGNYEFPVCAINLIRQLFGCMTGITFPWIDDFVHHVRNWTIQAEGLFYDFDCRRLNMALNIFGWEYMEKYVQDTFRRQSFVTNFPFTMETVIKIAEEKERWYMNNILSGYSSLIRLVKLVEGEPPVMVLPCDIPEYIPEITRIILSRLPQYILAILNLNDGKVSFRSRGDLDCRPIAEKFGGGGHVNAAGANVSQEVIDTIMKTSQRINEVLSMSDSF